MPAEAQRASPDALLSLARNEGRGRLKIFLGASPGVGKTFAMLGAAKAAQAEGRDVVVGLVETHGRADTEQILAGLPILPRKALPYRNRITEEFDLDAALERRPGLLLVDEFAHTNVPGSRHPKRWQDVEELRDAGIDVWTTLNVQHLESLNDVVQKITGVRMRETVPDTAFDEADEIVLVDLSPEELLKRLAEGKVYLQGVAVRAADHFFKPQNLAALRELALRRAAERVDSDLVDRMQAQAIAGPWAAGERILACIGPDAGAPGIVRAAKRLADLIDAPWVVATVERPGRQLGEAARKAVGDAMRLAESLGAETKVLVGSDIPTEILRYARFENVTQIVVGRSAAGFLREAMRRSLPHELVRRAEGIAVHVLTSDAPYAPLRRTPHWINPGGRWWVPFLMAAGAVAIAILAGRGLSIFTRFPNISIIFLLAVIASALRFGIWPALFASALSFLSYNFFFIEPRYTFTIAQPHELLALVVFLVVAVIASTVAGKVRDQARSADERMRATRRLYEFTRKLSGLAGVDAVAEGAASEVHASLGRAAVVLIADGGDLALRAAWPPEDALDGTAMTAARWSYTHDEPAGADTGTLPTVPWFFLPLRTPRGRSGVLGVARTTGGAALDSEERALLETLSEQTGVALDRAALAREMGEARTAAESERIRNTLLASVSHDFRIPITSILGSATSLLELGDKLDPAQRADLLLQVKEEAEGLDEMVRNLLAITRIDAGVLDLRRDWSDLREIVNRVVSAASRRGASQRFELQLPPELPLVFVDPTLAEQAIANVVANAVTHTPATTSISIAAVPDAGAVALTVTDDGPGIDPGLLPRIFDKFVTAAPIRSSRADGGESTGLGLAITKGIMDAHGGTVTAQSPAVHGHGTRVTLRFPREGPAP